MNAVPSIAPAVPLVAEPVLSVRGLTTRILTASGPRLVVDRLSFDVAARETLAIIGESGSGKSVATQSILGLLPSPPGKVTAGVALFEGRDLLRMPDRELRAIRGNRIGTIFQEPMSALNPMMAVGDQIAETLVAHRGMGWSAARSETLRLLERVRIPDAANRAKLHPGALSGGMRQRIVIAAALICKPAILIADEPTTALDATVQAEILALIQELQQEVGCGVVFITHDMAVVRQIADRLVVMKEGVPVETGLCAEVLAEPRHAYTRTLIEATLPATPKRAEPSPTQTASPPPLVVEDLIVSFPRSRSMTSFRAAEHVFAVDGVSLTLGPGETVALVGESGSGKTTLARAILGLVEPSNGRIQIGGRPVVAGEGGRRAKVQYVFQDPQSSLDPRFRVWQSITEPLRIAGTKDRAGLRARASELLTQVGLGEAHLDRFTHELSGGQRQRLGIARALSIEPDLVIADEAVSALDATTRLQVLDLFETIQRARQLPFLFITHDFAVVTRIAHRVAVMRFGRLVEVGPTAAVLASPRHAYTRALIAAALGGERAELPMSSGHRIGPPDSEPDWRPMRQVGDGHFILE